MNYTLGSFRIIGGVLEKWRRWWWWWKVERHYPVFWLRFTPWLYLRSSLTECIITYSVAKQPSRCTRYSRILVALHLVTNSIPQSCLNAHGWVFPQECSLWWGISWHHIHTGTWRVAQSGLLFSTCDVQLPIFPMWDAQYPVWRRTVYSFFYQSIYPRTLRSGAPGRSRERESKE